jgi:hypothetical protein
MLNFPDSPIPGQQYVDPNGNTWEYNGTVWNILISIVLGGSNTQVLFNDAGTANGSANLTFVKTTNVLSVLGNIGIGNTSPAQRLTVNGNANSIIASFDHTSFDSRQVGLPGRFMVGPLLGGYPQIGYNFTTSGGVYTKIATDTAWRMTFGVDNLMTFSSAPAGAGTFTWTDHMSINTSGNVGIGTPTPGFKLEVNGSFAATTKSFVINHPTKPGKKLRYGSLEGPENGVYIRGRLTNSNVIELPEYWTKLVDHDSITVNLTPIGFYQKLFVESVAIDKVTIKNENMFSKTIDCYYTIFAERNDVDKLKVEI